MFISRGITNDSFKWKENEDGSVTITGYTGNGGEVVIPSKIDGKSVTSIGDFAFGHCTGLTSVTIPDSVTEIGRYAFYGCTRLTGINVSADNEYYSSDNGVLLDKVQEKLICCPAGFKGSYTIPDSVMYIDDSAFEDCTGLKSVTIPDGVTLIDTSTFDCCTGLTDITIPGSITEIGEYAFANCTGLKNIIIPDTVKSISESAFKGCKKITIIDHEGSYAENYCKENGLRFEKII